jgi:hypothetical protein
VLVANLVINWGTVTLRLCDSVSLAASIMRQ